jgi:hypothetical protein
VIADPAWPSLVAAVAASDWPPRDLLAARRRPRARHRRDRTTTDRRIRATADLPRRTLTHHAATIDDDIPHPAEDTHNVTAPTRRPARPVHRRRSGRPLPRRAAARPLRLPLRLQRRHPRRPRLHRPAPPTPHPGTDKHRHRPRRPTRTTRSRLHSRRRTSRSNPVALRRAPRHRSRSRSALTNTS